MDTPIVQPLKRCSKCGREFPPTLDYFPPRKDAHDGLRGKCHQCHTAHKRQYYAEHRDEIRAKGRAYYAENAQDIIAKVQKWETDNPERKRANVIRWREANREKERQRHQRDRADHPERQREYSRRSYEKHHEKRLTASREYHRSNTVRYLAHAHKRRTRKLEADGAYTVADIDLQLRSQRGLCWWCSKQLIPTYHIDHRIPLTRGGSNNPDNLCLACPSCNLSKHNKLPHEWSDRLL